MAKTKELLNNELRSLSKNRFVSLISSSKSKPPMPLVFEKDSTIEPVYEQEIIPVQQPSEIEEVFEESVEVQQEERSVIQNDLQQLKEIKLVSGFK